MQNLKEIFQKAHGYKEIVSKQRYMVNFFKNDEIPMVIFSYVWTNEQATKRVRELNKKAKSIIETTFMQYFSEYFTQMECSKPEPNRDLDFDDFRDFYFSYYKNVHIHGIEIYETNQYLQGMEICYLVDGDYSKYALHHTIRRQKLGKGRGLANSSSTSSLVQGNFKPIGGGKDSTSGAPGGISILEKSLFKKSSIYFQRDEYIVGLKVTGKKYLHYLEIKTNHGNFLTSGTIQKDDNHCEFDIPKDHKVIAFSGLLEVMFNECRILDLSIVTKETEQDCDQAIKSLTYKDMINSSSQLFNVIKSEMCENIKRIKAIKLYPGTLLDKKIRSNKADCVGGIQITYELKSGGEFVDGLTDLRCLNKELPAKSIEIKDNEYITMIYGTGTDYIKTLCIKTNFYRRVKMGSTKDEQPGLGKQLSRSSSEQFDLVGLKGDQFSINLPAGAKVIAFSGTADDYLRSISAYYKI